MKILLLLVCLPIVFSVPPKRFILDNIASALDLPSLQKDLQVMVDVLGSDPTEMACEAECHKVLTQGHVLNYGCPLICHSFQTLLQQFHVTAPPPSGGVGKRLIFDTIASAFDYQSLKSDLQIMLDVLGSDPSEVACEAECHKILQQGHVLNYGCPLVCHAFQSLVRQFHLTTPQPVADSVQSKRLILDSIGSFFDYTSLKNDLQIMLDQLGSDPTEAACEAECHKLLTQGHVLNYGCPLVCHAFQSLVMQLHLTTPKPVADAPSKRLILDSIGSFFDYSTLKSDLQIMLDQLGSDPTEAACEAECHNLLTQGHVLNYGCPLVCHAFQTLVMQFHLTTPKPVADAPSKRLILDNVGSLFDFNTLKNDIQIMLDVLGSDPTEQSCEAECHNLLQNGHILNYGCPVVCHGLHWKVWIPKSSEYVPFDNT